MTDPGKRSRSKSQRVSWWMFHSHLWLGIITTALVLIISVTGILLNHKRGLGLMPDVPHTPTGVFESALSLADLAQRASDAVGPVVAGAGVDRMDVRPGDGIIKVRFDDTDVTEATVDIVSGTVLHVGKRNDVFLEKLHSGEIFGSRGVLLTDVAAIGLVILLLSGYWLWLYPRSRQ